MGVFDYFQQKKRGGYDLRWTLNSSGEWVFPDNKSDAYITKAYKELPTPYGLISAILKKTTIVPFEVLRVKNKSKELKYKALMSDANNTAKAMQLKNDAYDKIENSDLEKLLLNPNNYQSLEQLWWEIDGYKLLTGDSFMYGISGLGNKPKELHSIPSPMVEMTVKGTPFEPIFSYKVEYLSAKLPGEDVYHFKYWNPILSGDNATKQFLGQSPLQSCRMLLGRYKDADITQGFMFKNQGPAGLLSGDKDTTITQEQAVSVQDRFRQQHQGTHKANDIIITPSKLSWTSIGLSPVDLNIIPSKKEMVEELANAYNYPAELLGGDKKFNNYQQARKAELTDAVIPIVEARKAILNKFLCPKFGEDIRIEFDYTIFRELQDDLEKLFKLANEGREILTLDERRGLIGYDSLDPSERKDVITAMGLQTLDTLTSDVEEIDETLLEP